MASLTHTARLILRSRLRRHKDQLVIAQTLEGSYGAKKIGDLSSADLIALGQQFGLSIPSPEQCRVYEDAKSSGVDTKTCLARADHQAAQEGVNLSAITAAGQAPFGGKPETPEEIEAVDPAEAQPELEVGPTLAGGADVDEAAEAANAAAEVKAKAEADVRAVFEAFAGGDVLGYRQKLETLALRANRPDPKPVEVERVVYRNAAPVPQGSAKRVGAKTMTQVGLAAPMMGKDERTQLAVYDAANAPLVDKHFIWPDTTGAVLTQLARGRNVFLVGPAGTGKTTFAQQIAARWGREFVRISCDDQTEAATLVGMTVPDKDKGTRWQDGQLTAAIRRPGTVILVDEPSVARPGALFVLQAVLDSDRRIHIAETGEVVPVADDVLFLLADNTNGTGDITGAYEATRRLNRATLDRLGATVRFDYLPVNEEAKALHARTGCDKRLAVALCKFAASTRTKADKGEVSHPVGLRRLIALAELITDGVSTVQAYQLAVIETAPFDDQEPLRQIWTADFKWQEAA